MKNLIRNNVKTATFQEMRTQRVKRTIKITSTNIRRSIKFSRTEQRKKLFVTMCRSAGQKFESTKKTKIYRM